jgi:asparagine synthase (glutamine-hydrolysing)
VSAFVAMVTRGEPVSAELLARVALPIRAHGPDGGGEWSDGSVALLHRLLRTRDGAAAGPRAAGSGARLVGTVRLDNRGALVEAIRASGGRPPSVDDDDALLLEAYATWGEGMFSRLAGDFSFALWDSARRVMLVARDAFGVRPLYFAAHDAGFIASTALAAVRAHPAVSGALDDAAIVSFLRWGYVVDVSATSFRGVRRLPPGHFALVDEQGRMSAPTRWWTFPNPDPLRLADGREYVEGMRDVVCAAVRDRLRTPRGAILLSGGVDSTGLAAAARITAPAVTLTAFTMDSSAIVPDPEPEFARLAAASLKMPHEIVPTGPVPFEHLDDPACATPEPHDHSEFGAWRLLAATIAARSPVVIVGEDGDSLLQPPSPLRMARSWGFAYTARTLAHFVAATQRKPHLGLWLRRRLRGLFDRSGDGSMPSWVRAEVVARAGAQDVPVPPPHSSRPETAEALQAPAWQRLLEGFAPEFSGAPLEAVWPLLDERVLRFALALPPIPWCQQKAIFREAWRGVLPVEVLQRPKTPLRGFPQAQVALWRSRHQNPIDWDFRTAEFVDTRSVSDKLQSGSVGEVLDGWRALVLDRWLRSLA